MKKCTLFLAILLTGLLFADLSAKNGELALKDGRVMEGDIAEKADSYDVTAPNGVSATFRKDEVKGQPEYYDTLVEGYDKKKAKIAKDDVKGLLALATWARNHKLNDQMGDAAAAALAAEPTNVRAKLMLEASRNRTTQPGTDTVVKPGPGPGPRTGSVTPVAPTGKLTDKDVNAIRLMEMAAADRVPMALKRDDLWNLVLELTKDKATDPRLSGAKARDDFLALKPDPFAQLSFAMAKITTDQYYRLAEKVTVRSDPACLTVFKTKINPWLVRTCGAVACHGGGNPLAPYRLASTTDDGSVYTNFYVVSEFVGKSGRLLDRDRPENSLIAKFGLNPKLVDAKEQHPQVKDLPVRLGSPSFPDKNAPIYQIIMSWLAPSMGDDRKPECIRTNDRVDYHITFPVNGGAVATTQRETPVRPPPIMPPPIPGRPGPGGLTPGGPFLPPVPPRTGPGVPAPGGTFQPAVPPRNGPG